MQALGTLGLSSEKMKTAILFRLFCRAKDCSVSGCGTNIEQQRKPSKRLNK
jgi:hypothetical protein